VPRVGRTAGRCVLINRTPSIQLAVS
jgi:hypothetical protein